MHAYRAVDACNGWIARNDIPAGQNRTQTVQKVGDVNQWTLKSILEGPYPNGTDAGWITVNLTTNQSAADHQIFDLMQSAYSICINDTAKAMVGLQPVSAFLGTVAAAYRAGSSNSNLSAVATLFEKYGISGLQILGVFQDDIAPDTNIVWVQPPQFEDLPPPSMFPEYFKVSSALFAKAHPSNLSINAAEALMHNIVDFETQLTEFSVKGFAEQQANATDDTPQAKMSLVDFQSQAPELSLPSVLGVLVPANYYPNRLIVKAPTYYANASRLVANTPAEILEAFYLWRATVALAPYVVAEEASDFIRFQVKAANLDPDSQQQAVSERHRPKPFWRPLFFCLHIILPALLAPWHIG
jgi:endothelin-converting enzyme